MMDLFRPVTRGFRGLQGLRGLVGALCVLAAGCSPAPEPEGAPLVVRHALLAGSRYEVGTPLPVERETVLSRGLWKGRGGDGARIVEAMTGGEFRIGLRLRGAGKRSLTTAVPVESGPSRYVLDLVVAKGTPVEVTMNSVGVGGALAHETVNVQGTGTLQRVTIPVAVPMSGAVGSESDVPSVVVFEFSSAATEIDVFGISAIEFQAEAKAGDIYPVGPAGDRRHGLKLGPGHRIATDLAIPADAHLSLSLRGVSGSSRLVIKLDGEEIESVRASGSEWRSIRVPLSEAPSEARSEAHLTIEVAEKAGGPCWVAEGRVDCLSVDAPTVILITSDTHRADHMGRSGAGGLVRTPVLDAVADRGVFFTNCFTATNVTNPSHIALMTGTHLRDTRIANNATALAPLATTIAEVFRDAGYRTFAATSVQHLTAEQSGLDQGFDRYDAPQHGKRDGAVALARLVDWLGEADYQPVFIWLHVYDAHAPYAPPAKLTRNYYPKDRDPRSDSLDLGLPESAIPAWLKQEGVTDPSYVTANYRAAVDYVDTTLADLLALPRMSQSVIAFTSDQGESFGTDGVWWDHRRLNVDTLHVPLVLAWPGSSALTCDVPVRQIDIGATLIALADIDTDFEGRDLRWALEDSPAVDPRFGISAHGFSASIESEGWLLSLQMRPYSNPLVMRHWVYGEVELFDLNSDPAATENVLDGEFDRAHGEFDRAQRMRARLIAWLDAADPVGLARGVALSQEALDSLKSLGYGGATGGAQGAWWKDRPDDPWNMRFTGER